MSGDMRVFLFGIMILSTPPPPSPEPKLGEGGKGVDSEFLCTTAVVTVAEAAHARCAGREAAALQQYQ
eukprot:gene13919-biopygen6550